MQSCWILWKGNRYTLKDVTQGEFADDSPLLFCKDWLNGKNDFTLQTSGSTGVPKQISVTRQQVKASAQLTLSFLQLRENDVSLVCLDTRYIAGIMMLVRSMEAGMNMLILEPTANPIEKIPSDISIDFTALVPYQLETILRSDHKNNLNKIKIALIGGAPLSGYVKEELNSFSCTFYATYGMTETLSHIALQKLNGDNAQDFFHVLPGMGIRADERGCLVIEAPHLNANPIITNDLVEIVATNQFRWLGRIDSVINSGGVKVMPERLESTIATVFTSLKISNRFFVAGVPHPQLGESVALIIEGTLQTEMMNALINMLSEELPRYENPKSIHCLEKFVYTNTGKINRPETTLLVDKELEIGD